ncbi:MAG: RsmE family RNA methyltransferase [Candidatus Atribacteria bacterium]|nr:RsmE family RNA methyltransferase [Candidatus Atribacteria bacterium]
MSRFYYHPSPLEGTALVLSPEETKHLLVERVSPGSSLFIGDGGGHLFSGSFIGLFHRQAKVEICQQIMVPKNRYHLTVWQPLLKVASRMDWIVEKLTEIGVTTIGLFLSERCAQSSFSSERLERWKKISREACKQSGRLVFPRLLCFEEWKQFVMAVEALGGMVLVGDPKGETIFHFSSQSSFSPIQLIIGPEGDLTDGEKEVFRKRKETFFVRFSKHILRSETASLYGAILCMTYWEQRFEDSHKNSGM